MSWHVMGDLAPHAVRRRRRLDLIEPRHGESEHRIDLHFRDSHVDDQGFESIMHEYTMSGTVDLRTGRIGTVSARANVLPWVECPGAAGQCATGGRHGALRAAVPDPQGVRGSQHLHTPQRQPALPGRRDGTAPRLDVVGMRA